NCVPKWPLWRRVVWALGQLLACLADGHACLAGGGADVSDRREQGVLPEVIGLPPGDLIQQVRLGSAVERRSCQDGVLELLVCRPRNAHSGRKRSRIPSRVSGLARLAPHQSNASAARRRNTSAGKVLSRGCSGASSGSISKMSTSRPSPSSRIRRGAAPASGGGGLRGGTPRRESRLGGRRRGTPNALDA